MTLRLTPPAPLPWLLIATLACVTGCATTVSPKTLRAPAERQVIHLAAPLRWWHHDPSSEWENGLLAGDYVAEYEDDGGTYFHGHGTCVLIAGFTKTGTQVFGDGGIYLPRTPGQPWQAWHIRLQNRERVTRSTPDEHGGWRPTADNTTSALMAAAAGGHAEQGVDAAPATLCGAQAVAGQAGSSDRMAGATVIGAPHPMTANVTASVTMAVLDAVVDAARGDIQMIDPAPQPVTLPPPVPMPATAASATQRSST